LQKNLQNTKIEKIRLLASFIKILVKSKCHLLELKSGKSEKIYLKKTSDLAGI
jgi:hypothetical protein